jgi:hypothetical protein
MNTATIEGSEQATQYKSSLADIVAGDTVIWRCHALGETYRLAVVSRTTKTQIVLKYNDYEWKFKREGGDEISSGGRWHRECIYAPLQKSFGGQTTMLDVMAADKAERIEKEKRKDLCRLIEAKLTDVPLETLEEVAKLLGVA